MRPPDTRQFLSIIRPIMEKNPSKSYDFDGFWSEWGDSNSRHLAPKASALPTALHPVMKFSNCGQTCGHGHFLTSYRRGEKCCQAYCPKAFQVFQGQKPEPGPHAPKASALPTALHPDMKFSNCGQTGGQGHFLTSGISKMVPASGSVPAGCGVGLFPSWMGGICSQTVELNFLWLFLIGFNPFRYISLTL